MLPTDTTARTTACCLKSSFSGLYVPNTLSHTGVVTELIIALEPRKIAAFAKKLYHFDFSFNLTIDSLIRLIQLQFQPLSQDC